MATRTPKGPVAAATPKKAVAKPPVVPAAAKPVPAPAPVAVKPAPAAPAVAAKAPVPVAAKPPVVKKAPPVKAAPAKAPVAHAVEEVKAAPAPATPAVPPAKPVAAIEPPEAPVIRTGSAFPPVPATVTAAAGIPAPAEPVVQAIAQTKEKVEKMSKQVFATFEDVVGFQKDNVEAIVASSTILTKGIEALSKELAAFTQAQYEQSVSATKALFAVKSVKELVDLQTEFAKTAFDAYVAEATKVSEAGFKFANEAAEPITARVNATVEKLSKLKAA